MSFRRTFMQDHPTALPTNVAPVVRYASIAIADTDVFYREAGPADAPAGRLMQARRRTCFAT
jgi:hypothetical protein